MDNKENKTPAEELADKALDDVAGGANMCSLSKPSILSSEQVAELIQQKPDPDAPNPKLSVV